MKHCKELRKKLDELKEIYPEVVDIVNNWQIFVQNHGEKQTKEEKRILTKYVKVLKDLEVLK